MKRFAVPLLIVLGCGTEEPSGPPALFPTDYHTTYQETRDCRMSLEHSATVRILVSPDGFEAYQDRTVAFPEGSIVLKEEFAQRDVGCTGAIERYTVMRKLAAGSSPDTLDWEWQEVGANFRETQPTDVPSCVGCHTICGKAPQGYDGTCAEDL